MRCDVQISYDPDERTRILNIRKARKTQSVSITMDLIEHLKNPSKQPALRADIELKLRPLLFDHLGISDNEMKAILDEFLTERDT